MHTTRAAVLFYLLTSLFFPVSLLGYVLWMSRLLVARRSGISATAQGPLSARWMQHHLGTRPDEPAARLLMVLPSVSPLAVWLVFGPMLVAARLSGYVPPTFRYPFVGEISLHNQAAARQTFYDGVVDRYGADVTQVVILGAGFDTRAFRLPRASGVRAFEVDTPKTVRIKEQAVQHAGIDPLRVTFVAADFGTDAWLPRLTAAGFATDQPALLLWEGVTPYLERSAVQATLSTVATLAPGSVLAFDYITTDVLESSSPHVRLVRRALQVGGEPLRFGLESTPPVRDRVVELLQSSGLALVEQRTAGTERGGQRAWGGFAIAVVK